MASNVDLKRKLFQLHHLDVAATGQKYLTLELLKLKLQLVKISSPQRRGKDLRLPPHCTTERQESGL